MSETETVDGLKPEDAAAINRIRAGRAPIVQYWDAIRAQIQAGAAAIEWSVDLRPFGVERVVTANLLTLGEQVEIVEACGVGWEAFNPIHDARHALALLNACKVPNADTITSEDFDAVYSTVEQRPADPS